MIIQTSTSIQLVLIAEEYQLAFDALNEQIRNAKMKPHIIVTNDWKIQMAVSVAMIQQANNKARSLEIEDGKLKSGLLKMALLYDQAMLAITSGIDAKNFVLVMAASSKIREGNAALRGCVELLRES